MSTRSDAAKKAAVTKRRRAVGHKAAVTKRRKAGARKAAATRAAKRDTLIPPITVGFEEAVTRILKVKPEPKR